MNHLRLTIIQSDLIWQNIGDNLKNFDLTLAGLSGKTDLVVLPEMFTTGFSMDTSIAEEYPGVTTDWLKMQSSRINASIIGSIMAKEDGRFFNRLIVAQPDGTVEKYDKKHLFSYGGEDKHFSSGQKRLEVNILGWKICPLVCYDLRFPVWSRNTTGYDLLIYIASWPDVRSYAWNSLLTARAIENQCYTVGVNRVGEDGNGLVYKGDSKVLDFMGQPIVKMDDQAGVQTVILNMEDQANFRNKFPFLKDQDPFLLQ